MVELEPARAGGVAPLFDDDVPNRPMLESVLGDRNPGWIFADRAEQPTAAVVVSRYSFTYLGGRPGPALVEFALARSAPVGNPLIVCPADVAPGLGEGLRPIDRLEFSQLDPTRRELFALPHGVSLQPMTLAMLEQCLWRDEVLADCGSLDRFLAIGFGVCGLLDRRVVAEAYASVQGDRAYEIGAIVHPEFRRRGLGLATCAALIDECQQRGFETVWSCDRENEASARLARALGYRRERPYRFWQRSRPAKVNA
jgi:ribosomal protein S18 acetylase RimI-like enzyme